MKLHNLMEMTEIVAEAVKGGWMDLSDYDWEFDDYDTDGGKVVAYVGENDEFIALDLSFDVDARTEDHGIGGFEYWGAKGNDVNMVNVGEVNITGITLDSDAYDRNEMKAISRLLRVPGRKSMDASTVLKYFLHAGGGQKKVAHYLEEAMSDEMVEKLVDQKIEQYNDYDPY